MAFYLVNVKCFFREFWKSPELSDYIDYERIAQMINPLSRFRTCFEQFLVRVDWFWIAIHGLVNGEVKMSGRSLWIGIYPSPPHRSQSFSLENDLANPDEDPIQVGIVRISTFDWLIDPNVVSTPYRT
jgi:hypothetical protein